MKLLHLIRNVIAIAAVAALVSAARSRAAELKPLVVIGISLDRVAVQHPVPTYPRTAQILKIAGDVQLLVQVERGEVVGITVKSGGPMLGDFSSHWVRRHWKFKSSTTGQYTVPISYRLQS
jgi:Gram-negative bacterial TonB protein C-terminal